MNMALVDERLTYARDTVARLERKLAAAAETMPGVVKAVGRYRILLLAIDHTFHSTISLYSLNGKMRSVTGLLSEGIDAGEINRKQVLQVATVYGEAAHGLYKIADRNKKFTTELLSKPGPNYFLIRQLYQFMAWYHERVAIWTEDYAETLALSASEDFTKLVGQELEKLHEQKRA